MGQDLDRPLDRRPGVHPVVLDAHQAAEPGSLRHAGAGEHPGIRGGHHEVGVGGVRLVERAGQRRFRVRVGRLPPVARDQRVVLAVHRVLQVARLVADDQPPRAQPRAGQPGPAEHAVRPEEGDVHARVAGRGDVRPLRRRPVLVVAEREQRAGPVQQVRVGVDVHAGDVGERQAEAFSQLDELPLVVQEHERAAGVVGPVQADRQRAVAVIGDAAGAVVEVVAAPGVVGLPGLDPVLDHDLACGGGGPDGDGDEPLRARLGVQPQQVGAFRPAVRRHGEGRFPVGLHRVGRADEDRLALPVPRHGRRPPHQPGQVAAVPAHPERAHRERARGGGRIDRDRLTGQHAGLARVPEHRVGRAEVPDVPVGVTGKRVLAHRPAGRQPAAGTGQAPCRSRRPPWCTRRPPPIPPRRPGRGRPAASGVGACSRHQRWHGANGRCRPDDLEITCARPRERGSCGGVTHAALVCGRLLGEWHDAAPAGRYSATAIVIAARGTQTHQRSSPTPLPPLLFRLRAGPAGGPGRPAGAVALAA